MHTLMALAAAEDNPFLYITGLPLHTLVVHFAVVMLPLSAIAFIAIVFVPRWRGAFAWATLVGLIIGTGAAFVSAKSGEALREVLGAPKTHATWGDILPWFGLLLLVVFIVWFLLSRKAEKPETLPNVSLGHGAMLIVGIIGILVSLVVIPMTVVVGHSGAEAVAERILENEAAEVAPNPTGSAAATGGLDASVVAQHASSTDCWSIVNGNVYNLTAWIPLHPGGPTLIEKMCGGDGSAAYNGQHEGDEQANTYLASYLIGPVGGPLPSGAAVASSAASAAASPSAAASSAAPTATSSAAAAGAITSADVATHSSKADCWSSISGNVYDLTNWIDAHPGGPGVIEALCGVDGTDMYDSVHQGQKKPKAVLDGMLVGPLG